MDQFAAKIETLEHQWMRAWMQRDRKQMKALASRDFIFLLGSTKAAILDRPSWLEAATTRFKCESYRFGEVYVREHGGRAVAADIDLAEAIAFAPQAPGGRFEPARPVEDDCPDPAQQEDEVARGEGLHRLAIALHPGAHPLMFERFDPGGKAVHDMPVAERRRETTPQ